MSDADAPAVEVESLRVRRGGREVLNDLSLTLARGQVAGLLGPSGSGKTTLMRSVVGIQVVDSGTVLVFGEQAGSPSVRARVGYVTQALALYDDLSVRENIQYFAKIFRAPTARAEEAIGIVQLERQAAQVVHTLSGGERARASLATALVGQPDLLALDEPTVGLDPVLRRELWAMFHRLAETGVTLLVSSHVMDEAAFCDELLLLREGRLLAAGTPSELRRRTGTADLAEAFLRLIEDRVLSRQESASVAGAADDDRAGAGA